MSSNALRAALWLTAITLVSLTAGAAVPGHEANGLLARSNTMCSAISPPPKGLTCGVKGYLQSVVLSDLAGNSSVPQLSSCRDLCAGRSNSHVKLESCTGFAYKSSTGLCVLYRDPQFLKEFKEDSTSPFQFFSQKCFHCPSQCPHPPDANIADNGDFEFSSRFIGPWSVEATPGVHAPPPKVVSPGRNSSHALMAKNVLNLIQSHDICSGQNYRFSVDIKVTSPKGANSDDFIRVILRAGQLTMQIRYLQNYTSGSSSGAGYGSWRTFQGTTKGHSTNNFGLATTDFSVEFNGLPGYSVYVDNFIFKPTNAMYKTAGKELLKNGGFESGALSPWTAVADNDLGDPQHSNRVPHSNGVIPHGLTADSKFSYRYRAEEYQQSSYYYYCSGSSSSSCELYHNPYYGDDLGGVSVRQNFNTTPGQLYLLSFVYRALNINSIVLQIDEVGSSSRGSSEWDILSDGEGYPAVYQGDVNYSYDYPVSDDKVTTFSRVFEAVVSESFLFLSFAGYGFEQVNGNTQNSAYNDIQIDSFSIKALAKGQSL